MLPPWRTPLPLCAAAGRKHPIQVERYRLGPPLRQPVEGRRWHVRRQRCSSPPPTPSRQTPPHSPCAGRAEPPRKARPASRRGRGSGGEAMQGRPAALPSWRTKKHLWQGCNTTIGTARAGGGEDRGPPRCRAATAGREVEDGGAYGRVKKASRSGVLRWGTVKRGAMCGVSCVLTATNRNCSRIDRSRPKILFNHQFAKLIIGF